MQPFKLGFIINPVAGLGGSVALKGSDDMVNEALELGAIPQANNRAALALEVLIPYQDSIEIYTASNQMGEDCAIALGFNVSVSYQMKTECTTAIDTHLAVEALIRKEVDIILFAGGDGTARDIAKSVITDELQPIPVLGIPAGCKIHSGVYAVTPKAAGRIIELMVNKELVTLSSGDVMDIDENLFREGVVKAKRYSEMLIPSELRYVQAVKSGGKESDELVLQDIAADVIDIMADAQDTQFIIGSGSTTAFLMEELHVNNTLLGVDLVCEQSLIANDLTEAELYDSIKCYPGITKLVVTLIGGQGHIFGRGNQQLSPRVIRSILSQEGYRENIIVIATKAKLAELVNKPLISDTGDEKLDQELSGIMTITTGYKDHVLYPIASPA